MSECGHERAERAAQYLCGSQGLFRRLVRRDERGGDMSRHPRSAGQLYPLRDRDNIGHPRRLGASVKRRG